MRGGGGLVVTLAGLLVEKVNVAQHPRSRSVGRPDGKIAMAVSDKRTVRLGGPKTIRCDRRK